MRKSYVYKITCKITGEFYFGSSFKANRDWYWGSGRRIKEQIAKYGKENFVKEILGEFDDRTIAHQVENYYIEKFRHDDKCLNQMLNRRFGSFSEETCAKISDAKLGKIFSEEHRAKLSAALRGKHLSEEHRAKIGAANAISQLGKHLSEEHRAKISAANLGKHQSDETRAKISATIRVKFHTYEMRAKLSASHRGDKNPMYGKHWRKNPITGKREYYD